ncbi:MAG: hypothetical protein CMI02_07980 [Oceanospirillaceae bacterium]|nr:hypothetical protein [Oceanospirillaceae bacterium]MBT11958.1 hypothetical protein [Oceanospirillaceae bacterium]|tara:strand:- start:71279 stop:71770 length:492 start_codon:yes stop_codon:yes gene_type:complete
MMKNICITKILSTAVLALVFPLAGKAELAALNDEQMAEASGQSGLTISARVELDDGSRVSYTNTAADYADNNEYWLVVDNITGAVEIQDLKLDLIGDFGPAGDTGALQWTLPEEIVFDDLKTDGIYMSTDKEVNAGSRFLMAVEVDGTLQLPASTTMTIFATE